MYRRLHLSTLSAGLLGLASMFAAGCSDPMPPSVEPVPLKPEVTPVEDCAASDDWFPDTPEMSDALFRPLPHPAGECPFYRTAWQNFLVVTQPDKVTGEPAIKSMPTIDDVFLSYKPHATRGTKDRAWLGDVKQAGTRDILIDQNGRTLFYGIHVNDKFAKFVEDNGLKSPKGIQDAKENLFFTEGVVELKSAWQEVDDKIPAAELDTYIHTKAWVPTLSQDPVTGGIVEDKDRPREITARLLALHVVFTIPGHPEFIWGSFEHTAANGARDIAATDGFRDVAPIHPRDENPDLDTYKEDDTVVHDENLVLYKAGTKAREANFPIKPGALKFDAKTQSFPGQQTSIYRVFPASKSNTTEPDEAIATLNYNVQKLFEKHQKDLHPNDRRAHYRLVGAQWLDKPGYFGPESTFQNDESSPLLKLPAPLGADNDLKAFKADLAENGGDSAFSLTAGEDRMSSSAMESFTQGPDSFPNCFSCHNTEAVTSKGVSRKRSDAEDVTLVSPKLLNVSHVLSQVILEECTGPENVMVKNGERTAVCPPIMPYDAP